ncbi:uncharacterized protein YkwD [Streptosporangium becharense]|uniref:Uncharacterized protein YkwD n=1 Tax=Streptosporangium becharense TaxID=1816182 RepID=A0A7W9IK01_9ACTN|nr:CAP domain-containing protein [Streptosporangium becharense]MBB2913885.1 uncharacterized protein YkwD [Streptosporangium becharense]MBB5821454.1 uncharacterized protein YkwD [Streptosporangium becharense]
MRKPLGALLCLGGLTAFGAPIAMTQVSFSTPVDTIQSVAAPQAVPRDVPLEVAAPGAAPQNEAGSRAACRVYAVKPRVSAGRIQASAARLGCDDTALVRIRLQRAVPGDDPVVKSASLRGVNGRVTVRARCVSGVYYAVVTDYTGNTARSAAVRVSCSPAPAPTPAPVPTTTTTAAPAPTATAAPAPGSSTANEVVRLTNAERQKAGCGPLTHDPKLRSAAQGHSADMAAGDYFDHTSRDGRTMTDRIKASGFSPMRAWAENIAMGQRTPTEVVRGWMNSPGHRANILNCAYTHIGVGVADSPRGIYWTQDFARH